MPIDQWSWRESRWTNDKIDWKKAAKISAGVDVGAVATKAAILCDNDVFSYSIIHTGVSSSGSADRALARALDGTGINFVDIQGIAATGYGRHNVKFARQIENEVGCHIAGARYLFGPSVRTVVDMGGQNSKVMQCTADGRLSEFYFNDKCATGLGKGVELLARLMHIPVAEMGAKSLQVEKDPEPVSTTCYLFANTEAMGLFREGKSENEVLATYLFAIAYRLFTLTGRVKMVKDLALTGGLAKNSGVAKRLERELNVDSLVPKHDPQLAGAIGAALKVTTGTGKDSKTLSGVA